MFDQILDLVGQPPGSLVYHFIILFAVEAALAMSVGQWMRERSTSTGRLTIGILIVLIARAVVLVASLLAWQGYLPTNVLLPPAERMVDTITVIALAWIFITMDDPAILRRNFYPDLAAAVGISMTLAGAAGTYYPWLSAASDGQLFNGQILDWAWSGAQVVLAAVGLIWMLTRVRYIYDPFLKGVMLILLGAAAAIHIVQPVLGDVAASVRVAQIVVMPMLAAVTYRHVVEQLLHWDEFEPSRIAEPVVQPVRPMEPASPPAISEEEAARLAAKAPPFETLAETVRAPQPPPSKQKPVDQPMLLEVIDAVAGLLSTLEQARIVQEAPKAVASALRGDIAVLAIVDEETQQAGIVGGYDNIAQHFLPRALLDLSDHPGIVNALGRLRQIRLTPDRDAKELRVLYEKLGIVHEGPAYIQPLVNKDERIGVLIVGSPYSERQFNNEERNLLDRLSPLVTASLLNVEKYESIIDQAQKDVGEESARMVGLADELTARTTELTDSRRQIEEMKQYIRDLHRQIDSLPKQQEVTREQLEVLAAEIERLRDEAEEVEVLRVALAEAESELAQLREANERLLQAAMEARQGDDSRVEQLQAENIRLRHEAEKVEALRREIEELRSRSASPTPFGEFDPSWQDARLAAQAEIASLRARLAQATVSQQEIGFLQEQLAIKAREVVNLQTRLTEAQAVADALREQVAGGVNSTRELEAMQTRVAQQAVQIASLRAQLADAEALPEAVRPTPGMDQAEREAMTQLDVQLRERSALVEALETQLSEKARAITELRGHMADVEVSLRNLERQLARKTDQVEELESSLEEAHRQVQIRIEAIESSRAAGAEVDQAEIVALQTELADRSAAVQTLERQLQEARRAMVALETELAETREAVHHAIDEARQIDSHDEVIASIAQELRTPMSSIMGYTDLLLRESIGILGTLQRKFLQRVKANTERMGGLLDDLIRITAIDTGRLELEPERIDVTYAVEEALMNVSNQFREKGLVLRLALSDNLPPLTADRDAFLQVMGHLLSNAALASPVEGEVQFMVTSKLDTVPVNGGGNVEAQCLYLAVEDSGSGIAPDDFERVFVRKYRADNPLIEGLGDTGVSMSLAKALIDAHGGRIWLDSAEGSGTTFHVLLPLQPIDGSQEPS